MSESRALAAQRKVKASDDLSAIASRPYSGRGIIVGKTLDSKILVGYYITARSEGSQARLLEHSSTFDFVQVNATNASVFRQGNPALLLYPALAYCAGRILVSNGLQTNLLYNAAQDVASSAPPSALIQKAFAKPFFMLDIKHGPVDITSYEPDTPNYTPRISAVVDETCASFHMAKRATYGMLQHIVHKAIRLEAGEGWFLSTYAGAIEEPLPASDGELQKVIIGSRTVNDFAASLYETLGPFPEAKDLRVGVAAALMNPQGTLQVIACKNRFVKEAA